MCRSTRLHSHRHDRWHRDWGLSEWQVDVWDEYAGHFRFIGLTLVFLLPFWSYYHILVVVITSTTSCSLPAYIVTDTQGRIQNLKKEGAQWLRGLAPNTFLAKLGDFSKNFRQKGVGVRPLPPSGPALDTVGLHLFSWFWLFFGQFGLTITLCSVGLGLNLTYSYSLWRILGLCQW